MTWTRYGRTASWRGAAALIGLIATAADPSIAGESFNELFPPSEHQKKKEVERDEDELLRRETEEEKLIDAMTLRRVKFDSDWDPDPTALPSFFYQFRRHMRMRAVHKDEPLTLDDEEIFRWPFLFMAAHNSFAFTDEERENLEKYLRRGGRLLVIDCALGHGGFMPSFMSEMEAMFPGHELVDMTPDHPRFGDLHNILYTFRSDPGKHSLPNQAMLVNGRIAVMFDHDDGCCAWEFRSPPTRTHPLGLPVHGGTTAERAKHFEWGFNTMLFLMTE